MANMSLTLRACDDSSGNFVCLTYYTAQRTYELIRIIRYGVFPIARKRHSDNKFLLLGDILKYMYIRRLVDQLYIYLGN